MDNQKHGKNKLSEGWKSERRKAFESTRNRVVIAVVRHKKRIRLKMKMVVPIVIRPRNLWGVLLRRTAKPPVDMVRVNHAHVKWRSLPLIPRRPSCGAEVRYSSSGVVVSILVMSLVQIFVSSAYLYLAGGASPRKADWTRRSLAQADVTTASASCH